MKATAQMGGLTAEQVENLRRMLVSGGGVVLTNEVNALCDLALQAIDRWVPVSERLPSGDDPVLTLSVNAHMTTKPAMAMRNSIAESIKHGRVPHYTHWMPLPPPPPERP